MGGRWYSIAVVGCWLATMTWLMVEKVIPTLFSGTQPGLTAALPPSSKQPDTVCWDIEYQDQSLGQAVTRATRREDGTGELESVVQFPPIAAR